jgi:hypothetical protein
MASKKTFPVKQLVEKINYSLATSTCSDSERLAMASVLETVLFDTNAYAGFSYLAPLDAPDFNESRRHYFLHRNL